MHGLYGSTHARSIRPNDRSSIALKEEDQAPVALLLAIFPSGASELHEVNQEGGGDGIEGGGHMLWGWWPSS